MKQMLFRLSVLMAYRLLRKRIAKRLEGAPGSVIIPTEVANESIICAFYRIRSDGDRSGKVSHKLHDILVMTVLAVVSGLEHWTQIEDFARTNEQWFKTFLDLPNGIPSHGTIGKVFSFLDPDEFERRIQMWIHALVGSDTQGKHIAIDGKTLRKSFDTASNKASVRMLNAYVHENHAVFGQLKVDSKTNEITAIPRLLEMLQLKQATVTIDAMGCQRDIAERRYFISSHSGKQAQKLATLIRNHWRVENELHWTLDVSFNEDQCRVRIENAAENLSRIRRISLILLKNDITCKLGIKSKRAKAGYDRNYLLTLLGFNTTNRNKSS